MKEVQISRRDKTFVPSLMQKALVRSSIPSQDKV